MARTKKKAPPKCGKALGHAEDQENRSDRLHEEIKRVNEKYAQLVLDHRELMLSHGIPHDQPNGNDGFFT